MDPRLEQLKETIELNYHCRAEHVSSTAVIEMSGHEKIWQGWSKCSMSTAIWP
jgi:hypothetical protein